MPGGRPKIQIDYVTAERLAHIQCTQDEIASILGVCTETLQRDKQFCALYKKAITSGRASLRRMQWKALDEGDKTMLIWLGKQYLSQRDKPPEAVDNSALDRVVAAIKGNIESTGGDPNANIQPKAD